MVDILKAKNIGPQTGMELQSIGITTLDQLVSQGWEEVFVLLVEKYPHRCNLNMACALIGAVEGVHWTNVSPSSKQRGKQLIASLKP